MINSRSKDAESNSTPEYSSREVSPTPLLLAQVLTANRTFLLHHGPTISELFMRSPREKFCNILDRFWSRFCRNWEVLLHGNPAVEVFGGIKLAAGGELGVGVGEENWGSGEREVLEDLVRQTEGLVDLTVSRFGQAAPPEKDYAADRPTEQTIADSDLPWLGSGQLPDEADGVIFGGTGAIARSSLRDISSWVEHIYTYGEYAYGVKDNPHRQRRKRRRKQIAPYDRAASPGPDQSSQQSTNLRKMALEQRQQQTTSSPGEKPEDKLPFPLPHDPRPRLHDRVASHDHATGTSSPQIASHPGIPPPIVNAAEESLNAAAKAAASARTESSSDRPQGGSTFGISSKWMNYLTLGLSGSGSTRSRSSSPVERPEPSRRTSSMSSTKTLRPAAAQRTVSSRQPDIPEGDEAGPMQTLDPAPDGHELEAQLAYQKYQENKGHFLIGIKGDLDSLPNENDENQDNESIDSDSEIGRKVLRTLQIELPERQISKEEDAENAESVNHSADDSGSEGSQPGRRYQRLRVLVYIHRPFIYTFLFEPRFPSLQISSYYSRLHTHLRPLHKPLLRSTALATVAERIAEAHNSPTGSQAANPENAPYQPPHSSPVFDLVFDPLTLTIHTSIPNIPDPGTHAAEGLATTSTGRIDPPPWTRLDAINVHSQILNTLAATAPNTYETERTSKTSRGWWVVWMRIPAAPTEQGSPRDRYDDCRTAFLVRKASDALPALPRPGGAGRVASGMSSMGGMFGFGSSSAAASIAEDREDGTGVGWGLGMDPRKYVEGLLSLNR